MARVAELLLVGGELDVVGLDRTALHEDLAEQPTLRRGLRRQGGLGRLLLQPREGGDEVVVARCPLGAGLLDGGQQAADGIGQREQGARDRRAPGQGGVAQEAEQVLPRVGHALQLRETEEAAGALDGVDPAEDAGQEDGVARVALQRQQIGIQRVDDLVALDEELLDDVSRLIHHAL